MSDHSAHPPTEQPDTGSAGARAVEHHFLVQAPVPPMDVDGLNVVVTGTIAFAIASVLCVIFYAELAARGNEWWLGICIAGFGLGLLGLRYCTNRRSRRRAGLWNKD